MNETAKSPINGIFIAFIHFLHRNFLANERLILNEYSDQLTGQLRDS
ncbi:hypothetical protein N9T33_03980 [Pseudomonadota bacterium]|nr:hypothetical protein [Pseudomonadota bacterium]